MSKSVAWQVGYENERNGKVTEDVNPEYLAGVKYAQENLFAEDGEECVSEHKGWLCTLRKTHGDTHAAEGADGDVCATWENK